LSLYHKLYFIIAAERRRRHEQISAVGRSSSWQSSLNVVQQHIVVLSNESWLKNFTVSRRIYSFLSPTLENWRIAVANLPVTSISEKIRAFNTSGGRRVVHNRFSALS
jgi:hypothetical protein